MNKIRDWDNDCWIDVKIGKIRTKEDSYQGQPTIDICTNDNWGLGNDNLTKLNVQNAEELVKRLTECINELKQQQWKEFI